MFFHAILREFSLLYDRANGLQLSPHFKNSQGPEQPSTFTKNPNLRYSDGQRVRKITNSCLSYNPGTSSTHIWQMNTPADLIWTVISRNLPATMRPLINSSNLTTVTMLLLELPDPNQELFIQTLHGFQLFPKLLLELRMMIWRCTFPQSRQFLYFSDIFKIASTIAASKADDSHQFVTPPIAHRIRRESRAEVLKHYSYIPRIFKAGIKAPIEVTNKSFFFNRSGDSLMMPMVKAGRGGPPALKFSNVFYERLEIQDKAEQMIISTILLHIRNLDLVYFTLKIDNQVLPIFQAPRFFGIAVA